MTYILEESHHSNPISTFAVSDSWFSGQVWKTESGYNIGKVQLLLEKRGVHGDLLLELKAVDVSDEPTGSALASATADGDAIDDTNPEWVDFVFTTNPALDSGEKYVLVLSAPDSETYITQYYTDGARLTDSDFLASYDSGANWSHDEGNSGSVAFKVYSQPLPEEYPYQKYTAREIENASGVTYDDTQKTVIYAEDIEKLNEQVKQIQDAIGLLTGAQVKTIFERLDDLEV